MVVGIFEVAGSKGMVGVWANGAVVEAVVRVGVGLRVLAGGAEVVDVKIIFDVGDIAARVKSVMLSDAVTARGSAASCLQCF